MVPATLGGNLPEEENHAYRRLHYKRFRVGRRYPEGSVWVLQAVADPGAGPRWEDSEVRTMEWVGEFLGYDQDKGIYNYFRQHWLHLFPDLARVHRTRWVRQTTRLVWVKKRLWRFLRTRVSSDSQVSIIDSFLPS
jgi:hypothetical protein